MSGKNPTAGIVGTVKWFNIQRGYGFASVPDGRDVFVHASVVAAAGLPFLREGDRIEMEIAPDRKTGKPRAARLKLL